MTENWEREEVFFDAVSYFAHLEEHLGRAERTIDFETYIYDKDHLGDRIAAALESAASRGVRVRVMVDAFGSPYWVRDYLPRFLRAGVEARVFHPMPFSALSPYFEKFPSLAKFFVRFSTMNERNHRKTCIIDRREAWVGGMNVSKCHAAWRDTGVYVKGGKVHGLSFAFSLAWRKAWSPESVPQKRWRRFKKWFSLKFVRLNASYRARREGYRDLLSKITASTQRLWITNPYFVPPQRLLKALGAAAARGVDVRILVPQKTDVFFMTWVSSAFYCGLIRAGVKVFEYLPATLHAKTLLIDNWATIGTTNLNHRSFFHDLEVDVVVTRPASLKALAGKFQEDLGRSREVSLRDWSMRPWHERLAGRILLFFRHWI